jgi:hypothetical protein
VNIHTFTIFADIYYCYEYFFTYYYDDPFSKLVYKILNKWVNNNHTENYSGYNYLYGKLSLFGDYTPWARVYADIETLYIGKNVFFRYKFT